MPRGHISQPWLSTETHKQQTPESNKLMPQAMLGNMMVAQVHLSGKRINHRVNVTNFQT